VGNATSRHPQLVNGITKFIRPMTNGMATKKIMMVPWAEKIWVVVFGRQIAGKRGKARACCEAHHQGVDEASDQHDQPPGCSTSRRFALWSTLVIHSRPEIGGVAL